MVDSKKSSNFATQKGKTTSLMNAKIAQLVEHDLAKVGVAGSSPVFRSTQRLAPKRFPVNMEKLVRVVELVDTLL